MPNVVLNGYLGLTNKNEPNFGLTWATNGQEISEEFCLFLIYSKKLVESKKALYYTNLGLFNLIKSAFPFLIRP